MPSTEDIAANIQVVIIYEVIPTFAEEYSKQLPLLSIPQIQDLIDFIYKETGIPPNKLDTSRGMNEIFNLIDMVYESMIKMLRNN